VSWFPEKKWKDQHIRMISEGSCETGVMAAKILLWHHRNELDFAIETE